MTTGKVRSGFSVTQEFPIVLIKGTGSIKTDSVPTLRLAARGQRLAGDNTVMTSTLKNAHAAFDVTLQSKPTSKLN